MFDYVQVNLVADGSDGFINNWVFPYYGHQVLWNVPLAIEKAKRLVQVFSELVFAAFLGIVVHRPGNQVLHKPSDVFPVLLEEVEIKGSFDLRFAQQFVEANEDNPILDQPAS